MIKAKFLIILHLISCICIAQSWHSISNFPGESRDDGTVFVIENKAYCGSGVANGGKNLGDFYSLNFLNDSWDTVASLPTGKERQYASAFSSNGKGYLFGGFRSGDFLNDLWKYDPNTDNWTQLSSLPSIGRSGMSTFVFGDSAIVVGGKNDTSNAMREVWLYRVSTDSWSQLQDLPFGGRWRASSVVIDTKGYLALGLNEKKRFCTELYEYEPKGQQWTKISEFPGNGRSYAAMEKVHNELVVLTGIDTFNIVHNDVWKYDLMNSNWRQLESIPSIGRRGGICFSNNLSLYYTTGKDQSQNRLIETWKNSNLVGLIESQNREELSIFPNPAHNEFTVLFKLKEVIYPINFEIFSLSGKKLKKGMINREQESLDASNLPRGIYVFNLRSEKIQRSIKLILD